MAWERIGHPSEMVAIDQEIEVKVLHIDREKQKIALGLKQKDRNPWENIETKYPVDSVSSWRSRQRDELRCVRQTRTRYRRPGSHQRDELDETRQSSRANWSTSATKIDVKILGVDPGRPTAFTWA